jgi:DNA-binding IclR family transcriptional regulator
MLPGVLALAAPIFDHEGTLAAVITALGPVGFFDDARDGETAQELRRAAHMVSGRLGYALPRSET